MKETETKNEGIGEVVLRCTELQEMIDFFIESVGFRLDSILPADNPRTALLSGSGVFLRLEKDANARGQNDFRLRIKGSESRETKAPNGMTVEFIKHSGANEIPEPVLPSNSGKLVESSYRIEGRAGMKYRDLIPGRLNGFMIASQISIAEPGPVPDYVHFHKVGFQVIYCRRGRVKVVYEDRGEPFFMEEGDVVLQPPGIRHRVLESSANTEVIEVSSPAEHETCVEHELDLPNLPARSGKTYGGQEFALSREKEAVWTMDDGLKTRVTDLFEASRGAVGVEVIQTDAGGSLKTAEQEFMVLFVLAGGCSIMTSDCAAETLGADDSYLLRPGSTAGISSCPDTVKILVFRIPYSVPK